ncbi:MAG: NTP transferase domain-containing protein [Patescibacteria group bacterium]
MNAVVILAAGKGSRMGGEIPKPLIKLHGKELVLHVLEAVHESGISTAKPCVVVGNGKEMVTQLLGESCTYVTQEKLLGTGHAVLCALPYIPAQAESILVLYADQPYVSAATMQVLVTTRALEHAPLAMATVSVPDFLEWRSAFEHFGRIQRHNGKVSGVVEWKDATEAERATTEVNPAYFVFDAQWLREILPKIGNKNAQSEYYLTDCVARAAKEGKGIPTVVIDAKEALGINTRAHLDVLEREFGN